MTSPSTKSEFGSRKRTRPGRLVRPGIGVQGIDEKDEKLLYIAYRLGRLPWEARDGIKPADFGQTLYDFLEGRLHYGWSTRRNDEPRLVAFGVDVSPGIVFIGDIVWHPKALAREKLELGYALLDTLRREFVVMMAFYNEQKPFFERLTEYGILRRVGTIYGLKPSARGSSPLAIAQTRSVP